MMVSSSPRKPPTSTRPSAKDIKDQGYNISDKGEIDDYLGVKIEKKGNTVTLTQPHLIDQILEDTGLSAWCKPAVLTPAASQLSQNPSNGTQKGSRTTNHGTTAA